MLRLVAVKNKASKFGFNLDNIQYLEENPDNLELPINSLKNHQISISSTPNGENWLPSGNEGKFYITLRMYNPASEVYNNLGTVVLPTIKRVQ